MRIVVFGAGYVGLVTGTCLAELGHEVLCVDIDAQRVGMLKDGRVPIYEPGLAELIRRNTRAGRLRFSESIQVEDDWREQVDVVFIAVGTPPAKDGSADISAVMAVAASIKKEFPPNWRTVVAVKSTVPVGTCDRVQELLGKGFEVASNPEFLKEGSAIQDFFKPDRVVIGSEWENAIERLQALYSPLMLARDRTVVCDTRSSELIKYASNAMLAMRISFMNELSRLCAATGANVQSVRLGVGSDSRIGNRFLYAGPGYGGSCFPKDVQALVHLAAQHRIPMRLARAAHAANEEQAYYIADLVKRSLKTEAARVAFWGCSFKPETDDVREAPSVRLAIELLQTWESCLIAAHDPEAAENFLHAVGVLSNRLTIPADQFVTLDGANVLVLLTEWRCYMSPDWADVKKRMAPGATVIDARNIWHREAVEAAGLRYVGLGT